MKLPLAARLRQQAADRRSQVLEENADQANAANSKTLFRQHPSPQAGGRNNNMVRGRFSSTNRQSYNQRSAHFITAQEMEQNTEQHNEGGGCFRYFFLFLVLVFVSILALTKYDIEYNLEVPQIESGKGFGVVVGLDDDDEVATLDDGATHQRSNNKNDNPSHVRVASKVDMDQYYNVLGVSGRLKRTKQQRHASEEEKEGERREEKVTSETKSDDPPPPPKEDPDKQRRRDNFKVRQELKAAYEKHVEGYGQLVHCGRACEAKNQQVEVAYNTFASQVDRELYGVLLDASDTRSKRSMSHAEMKSIYDKKRSDIENNAQEDAEDKLMALEELKDAYDILVSPDARTFYHLTGRKPPPSMKKTSARHGGWGQEVLLGTFKHRLVFAWLDYFKASWAETAVIVILVMFLLMRLPSSFKQTMSIYKTLEAQEELDKLERKQDKESREVEETQD